MIKNYSITSLLKLFFLIICGFDFTCLIAQNESDFYTETNHLGITQNLVTNYNANGTDTIDDSAALQNAIDYLTNLPAGGKIIIPSGTFYFVNIDMKSNVHLEIDANTTIIPTAGPTGNYAVFNFGKNTATINNVSIRGWGGNFTIDLSAVTNVNVRVFRCNNVNNFLLSDFDVLDNNTKFASTTMGFAEHNGDYFIPTNGVVKNATTQTAHYGYGLVQIQAGSNILYKNLSGEGGITLRMESGYHLMNVLRPPGVGIFDVYGRNIHCEDGSAAISFSPHTMENGHVDVDGVTAVNCGFAARVAFGFATTEQAALGLVPGYFAPTSVLKNVNAVYGTTAQLKPKHYKYMPCEIQYLNSTTLNPDGESYTGPSINAVIYDAHGGDPAEGDYTVTITNVTQNGFVYEQKTVLVDEDAVNPSQCPSVTAAFTHTNTNQTFNFDGSDSDDTNGFIASWYWDFGDGTTGTGEFVSHTYAASGSYDVHLQVTDNVGATNSMFQTVTGIFPLPVELSTFKAELISENRIALNWQTQSELNNKGFEIQRATDSNNWKTLAFVEGNGTSSETRNYFFIDKNPVAGFNYYRLKQIDFDGKFDFSKIKVINNNTFTTFQFYPTLATNFIQIETKPTDDFKIQIFDLMGKMILEKNNVHNLDVSNFQNGQYYIKILINGNWLTEEFLKI